ncbi:MAG: 2-amino-4-hydroxy-6-hydroxymethyldihydropteridine diphosphokinase [Pirellulales bacterium]|nr:2-amino-4-hydroxy-6-hydroxymethyldihydropteridine diphosphokinase [Pirellulales bacterium]
MAHALIALGSNLGDRRRTLDEALAALAALPGTRLLRRSRWHETAPVGGPPGQGEFLNGAALLETPLSPHDLLAAMTQIEAAAGRTRETPWGPRTLDLDLLLYDALVSDDPALALPHPHMAQRRFVLDPACEVAPGMLHPRSGWTVGALRRRLA